MGPTVDIDAIEKRHEIAGKIALNCGTSPEEAASADDIPALLQLVRRLTTPRSSPAALDEDLRVCEEATDGLTVSGSKVLGPHPHGFDARLVVAECDVPDVSAGWKTQAFGKETIEANARCFARARTRWPQVVRELRAALDVIEAAVSLSKGESVERPQPHHYLWSWICGARTTMRDWADDLQSSRTELARLTAERLIDDKTIIALTEGAKLRMAERDELLSLLMRIRSGWHDKTHTAGVLCEFELWLVKQKAFSVNPPTPQGEGMGTNE